MLFQDAITNQDVVRSWLKGWIQ